MSEQMTDPTHYDDCPINTNGVPTTSARPCRCDAIRAEDDAYWSEPADMADRENGATSRPLSFPPEG